MAISNLRVGNPTDGTGPYRAPARTTGTLASANTNYTVYTAPADVRLVAWQLSVIHSNADAISHYIDGYFYIGPDAAGLSAYTVANPSQGAFTTYGRGGHMGTGAGNVAFRPNVQTYGNQYRDWPLNLYGVGPGEGIHVRYVNGAGSPGTITWYLRVKEYL